MLTDGQLPAIADRPVSRGAAEEIGAFRLAEQWADRLSAARARCMQIDRPRERQPLAVLGLLPAASSEGCHEVMKVRSDGPAGAGVASGVRACAGVAISATGMGPLPSTGAIAARRRRSHKDQASQPAKRESEAPQLLCLPADGQLCTTWARGAVDYPGTGARSSTDRASDYGSEGWGFESLRARDIRPGKRP